MVRRSASIDGRDIGDGADDGEPRGDPRALQMMRDLVAHHVGLFEHFRGERIAPRARGLVDDHRQRRLDRMREIADMGARALDDLAVGVDQRIGLARQRRDLDREFALQPFGAAGADVGDRRLKCASAAQDQTAPERSWSAAARSSSAAKVPPR